MLIDVGGQVTDGGFVEHDPPGPRLHGLLNELPHVRQVGIRLFRAGVELDQGDRDPSGLGIHKGSQFRVQGLPPWVTPVPMLAFAPSQAWPATESGERYLGNVGLVMALG